MVTMLEDRRAKAVNRAKYVRETYLPAIVAGIRASHNDIRAVPWRGKCGCERADHCPCCCHRRLGTVSLDPSLASNVLRSDRPAISLTYIADMSRAILKNSAFRNSHLNECCTTTRKFLGVALAPKRANSTPRFLALSCPTDQSEAGRLEVHGQSPFALSPEIGRDECFRNL